MKNLSQGFILTLVFVSVLFGYFQGVVVPQTEIKYSQQAAVATKGESFFGSAKSFPCNPVQTKCGKLVIIKNADPDSYQDFTFVHQTIPGYIQTFTLDDDASLPNPSALPNLKAFYTPYNATFLVAEVVNPAFIATVTCVDLSGGTTVSGSIANIVINQGESVTCTFKNVPASTTTACTIPNTWTQRANFGGVARKVAAGFSIGTKGYIGVGELNGNVLDDFWEYNSLTNVWTQKADFGGVPREFAQGLSIGNKGYIGMGEDEDSEQLQDFWEYNPATNIWTQKANYGGGPVASTRGFSIGMKGYVGTGHDGSVYRQDFWEYNPATNLWTQKANFGGGLRSAGVGFSIGNKGYFGTGNSGAQTFSGFWEYNPAPNLWTQKANFGGGQRKLAVGFSIGSKGYVGTGYLGGTTFSDFWEYIPGPGFMGGTWNQKADFGGGPREEATGFSISGKGYIGVGDIGPTEFNDFWCYAP